MYKKFQNDILFLDYLKIILTTFFAASCMFLIVGCNKPEIDIKNSPLINESKINNQHSNNIKNNSTGGLDIELLNIDSNSMPGICNFYFEIKNNTDLNITGIYLTGLMKDKSGVVLGTISQGNIIGRIKMGGEVTAEYVALSCKEISDLAKLQLTISIVEVDGQLYLGGSDKFLSGIRKSRVQGIEIDLK